MLQSTMGEARMDVIDSEIAYLGYYESESYGLVWKVSWKLDERGGIKPSDQRYDVIWCDVAPCASS